MFCIGLFKWITRGSPVCRMVLCSGSTSRVDRTCCQRRFRSSLGLAPVFHSANRNNLKGPRDAFSIARYLVPRGAAPIVRVHTARDMVLGQPDDREPTKSPGKATDIKVEISRRIDRVMAIGPAQEFSTDLPSVKSRPACSCSSMAIN
jgi:hypothetical protein